MTMNELIRMGNGDTDNTNGGTRYEDTARRWRFANQEERPQKKPTMPPHDLKLPASSTVRK